MDMTVDQARAQRSAPNVHSFAQQGGINVRVALANVENFSSSQQKTGKPDRFRGEDVSIFDQGQHFWSFFQVMRHDGAR